MADHHHHFNHPLLLPFPHSPTSSSPYLLYHPPLTLMASALPSKPLNPYADPFLSTPLSFLPSPPPPPPPLLGASLMSGFGNLYYPRASTACFWQLNTYPSVSCYNAWPQVIWPPCQTAVEFGGGVVADSKHVFKRDCGRFGREFLVSGGPRREIKSPPQWVEKKISDDVANGGDVDVDVDDPVEKISPCSVDGPGITTVMIKNIPNQFKRRDLLQLLDRYCQYMNQQRDSRTDFSPSEYDFVYLPMDFRRSWYEGKVSNLGYAFVNFTTPKAASHFCAVYHNYKWDVNVNKKICEITDARIQGKEALTNAFKNKIFWCRTDQYLPVMLSPPSNGRRRYRKVNVGRRIARLPRKPIKKPSS